MATAAGELIANLSTAPETFLQPTAELHGYTLAAIKEILDPLAVDVADAQKTRRDENRKKRKRGDTEREESVLQLRQVYINGLAVKQVWEQAKKIVDAACAEIEDELAVRRATQNNGVGKLPKSRLHEGVGEVLKTVEDDAEMSESDQGSDNSDEDSEDLVQDNEDEELSPGDEDIELDEDDDDGLSKVDSDSDNNDDGRQERKHGKDDTYIQDPNNLNDGFFSIDDFNKQTQFLEQQDARGDDDNPSDEDEVDWDVNPLTAAATEAAKQPKNQSRIQDALSDTSDEENDGPTFGNANLDASDSDDEDLEGGDLEAEMPGLDNTNEIRYTEFFEPPPKKLSKTKRMRALPKTQPDVVTKPKSKDNSDNEIQRAMDDVRRDLLDSEEEESDLESGSDMEATGPRGKNLSTHEKQKAAIAAEIRRLEAANVAKKDWTLAGEARAVDRPLNSLIEEDMEFERAGKPVPVITAEVSEEIEQLIKRRILAREFDEVIRRLPDALGNAAEMRRGRIELDDSKAQSGLAEAYEQEHLKATDPGYVDKRSAATKKQHAEIDRLWKEVSSQLDLLSNLHFKPKRADMEIKTVEDKPTISMEDARPVGGTDGEQSMLAPQEVYRPGVDGGKGEVGEVRQKSGAIVNKEEMSREEKLRRRRREKERTKKSNGSKPLSSNGKGSSSSAAGGRTEGTTKSGKVRNGEKEGILKDLQKGNVKVIGKKGELQDIGRQKKGNTGIIGGSSLKL